MNSLRQLSNLSQTFRQQRISLNELKDLVNKNQEDLLKNTTTAKENLQSIKEMSATGTSNQDFLFKCFM